MHTRQQPHSHRSPNRLCDLPLIHRAQARVPSVSYPAHGRHVFRHHAEILYIAQALASRTPPSNPPPFFLSLSLTLSLSQHLHAVN